MESTGSTRAFLLRVNGSEHRLDIEARVTLLDALRETIGLTGTKKGCNQGACGACTVLVDGVRVNACLTLAMQCEGAEVVTIEGLASAGGLHPLQRAFIRHDGFQCGYCTPGQLCSAVGMIGEFRQGMPSAVTHSAASTANAPPQATLSEQEIKERMSGNLCRCGAYGGITAAIVEVMTEVMAEADVGAETTP